MTRQYARRVDANQSEIVRALEGIGVGVIDLSGYGDGVGDLLCVFRGKLDLLEVKSESARKGDKALTLPQIRVRDILRRHGGTMHVVRTVPEALAIFGARAQ